MTEVHNEDLNKALLWLHEKSGHELTILLGDIHIDSVLVRGTPLSEGGYGRNPDAYTVTVYAPAFTLTLDPDDLEIVNADGFSLEWLTQYGRNQILDESGQRDDNEDGKDQT